MSTFKTLNQLLKEKDLNPFEGHTIKIGGKEVEIGDIPGGFNQNFQGLLQMANKPEEMEAQMNHQQSMQQEQAEEQEESPERVEEAEEATAKSKMGKRIAVLEKRIDDVYGVHIL